MCALAALTALSASARAQTPGGICDRTSQVQAAILDRRSVSDCADVTASDLSGITRLDLSNKGIAALQSGDFAGLSSLHSLWLAGNQLSALPDGVFDNLSNLHDLWLHRNPGAPFPFTMEPVKTGDNTFEVRLSMARLST